MIRLYQTPSVCTFAIVCLAYTLERMNATVAALIRSHQLYPF